MGEKFSNKRGGGESDAQVIKWGLILKRNEREEM